MRHRVNSSLPTLLALITLFSGTVSYSQTSATGTLLGSVTDPSGAVVAGAQIEVINAATGGKSTTTTGSGGAYSVAGVNPGSYTVKATASGFQTTEITDVNVQVNTAATVNFKLQIGQVSSAISVTAEQAGVELATADSTLGDVIGSQPLLRLPTRLRQAQELLLLQPGSTPQTGSDNGASIAGALNDQTTFTLDGIDITDNSTNSTINSDQGARPVLMVSVEATDEFRVAVANSNASFTRGSGGQVTLIQRSGTNQFHGSTFWYTQNSILNANTWDNNRLGLKKPHVDDNRFGGRFGGPIIHNKTFFFAEYEARRYPETFQVNTIVPTASLRSGILRFKDSAGNVDSYNLATSSLCGTGTSACDPRGIGLSPTMRALMALEPTGNNPNVSGVDNLNTTGFTANAASPLTQDFGTFRLDHNFSDKWHFNGSFSYSRDLEYNSSPLVLDIRNANDVLNEDKTPAWTTAYVAGLTGQLTNNLVNTVRFGYVDNRNGGLRPQLSSIASTLALPGTNDGAAGYVAVSPNIFTAPITMSNTVRTQFNRDINEQVVDDLSWTKNTHAIQVGGNFQRLPLFHVHTGKVGGAVNSLNATTTADSSFLVVPSADRPPTCSSTLSVNCLPSSATNTWDSLYTTALGLMNDDNTFLVRNSSLQSQPFGTAIQMNSLAYYYSFYGMDTWKIKPSLTLTYGLSYGVQTPYNFANKEEALLVNASTNQLLSPLTYLQQKQAAALQGQIYNPMLGFLPVANSGRSSVYNTDYGDAAPRAAVAWNPSFKHGFLGTLFGDKKTVIRGGYGMYYSRLSGEYAVVDPGLTAGFNSTITTGLTSCTASGSPGAACNAASTNPALSVFRLGVDGSIPVPTAPGTVSSPYVPAGNYSELVSTGIDPFIKNPRIHSADLTIQRDLGKGNLLEVGWNGRFGRRLYANVEISASPYMFKDSASGQTFAQAYDSVANALRAGQTVTAQPFFENQLPGAGAANGFASTTAFLASREASYFTNGLVANLFDSTSSSQPGLNALRARQGLQPYDETQVNEPTYATNLGTSNYNAFIVTLKHTGPRFTYDVNYTYSKSLDTNQGVQNDSTNLANPYNPGIDYAPSRFDHTHILNAMFVYNLPRKYPLLPRIGNEIVGGWYVSGILSALSGAPLYVTESSQVWGGGQRAVFNTPATVLVPSSIAPSAGVNSNVNGSGGIGTAGSSASGGSGLNIFSNPQAAYNDFGYVQLSNSGDGSGNPMRGLPFWNLDTSFGKKWPITERVNFNTSFDFYNLFNHPNFATPSLVLTGTSVANFGVISRLSFPPTGKPAAAGLCLAHASNFDRLSLYRRKKP